ncbi:hypothetical protein MPH_04070 [Macrophomina phaseolina MS6]|uniref:Uncharacterized protein n=1 Tax=Macrophomina phaseolina (strain MS6) TaxID=1126212 RepID=K2SPG2_MACPH|nr:hypothetical protein MPH_04070 [Macrophomina phaseolina MS6]
MYYGVLICNERTSYGDMRFSFPCSSIAGLGFGFLGGRLSFLQRRSPVFTAFAFVTLGWSALLLAIGWHLHLLSGWLVFLHFYFCPAFCFFPWHLQHWLFWISASSVALPIPSGWMHIKEMESPA